jgi:hypothetical protein
MMTERLRISILAAPLACIDRRALSQAWYSALRCAREVTPQAPSRVRSLLEPSPKCSTRADSPARVRTPERAGVHALQARPAPARRDRPVAEMRDERRAQRSRLARDIERTLLDPPQVARRASFTLGGNGKRVHVVLQTKGDRVTLVAVCPPSVRTIVSEALAQARYALAGRRVTLDVERGVASCS